MTTFPIVLSAPSGGGKTTVAHRLLARRGDIGYSTSCTTRAPRTGEVHGTHYHFLSADEFDARLSHGEFAEWADVHGRRYGTLASEIQRVMEGGQHVMLDIDVQGAEQIGRAFPEAVLIFLLPPSAEVLIGRLTGRGTEDPETIARRLRNALEELRHVSHYHYVVVNDDLDQTVARVSAIVDAEMARYHRVATVVDVVALSQQLEQHLHTLAPT